MKFWLFLIIKKTAIIPFMKQAKFLILMTVFIDVLGLGIIIPILPFYVQSFGASSLTVTAIFAIFSLCAFLSAPLISSWSDRIGRRPMLIASIMSTSLGWFVFALAPNIIFLFIGRIIDGLAAGNLPVAQSYLVDLATDDKDRAHNLGLIGAMFGIGFIVGPMIGGFLAHFNHSWPFLLAGTMALINALLAYRYLPETLQVKSTKAISFNPLAPLIKAVRDKALRPSYSAWMLFCIAIAIYQSIFALFLLRSFGWNELMVGFVFTGSGLIIAFNQGWAMKRFWLKYFSLDQLNRSMTASFALGFLMLCLKPLWLFGIGLVLITLGQSVFRSSLSSSITSTGTNHGEKLGIMSAILSLAMALAPLTAGVMLDAKLILPFLICSGLFFGAYLILNQATPSPRANTRPQT